MTKWKEVGFILASKYRKGILEALSERPKTPKELAEEIDMYLSHTSLIIKELLNKGIIKCLTPKRRKGRIYGLTEDGKEILIAIREG